MKRTTGLRTATASALAAGMVLFGVSAWAEPPVVDQLTDPSSTAASGMFAFTPMFVAIAPGEPVTFLNSSGAHTVNAIPEIWPEGVPKVAISGRAEADFTFEHEGFYGITCRRHGRYGMVMLVKVGEPEGADALMDVISGMRGSKAQKKALTGLVDGHLLNGR